MEHAQNEMNFYENERRPPSQFVLRIMQNKQQFFDIMKSFWTQITTTVYLLNRIKSATVLRRGEIVSNSDHHHNYLKVTSKIGSINNSLTTNCRHINTFSFNNIVHNRCMGHLRAAMSLHQQKQQHCQSCQSCQSVHQHTASVVGTTVALKIPCMGTLVSSQLCL